jgi:ankyrin repeat protein
MNFRLIKCLLAVLALGTVFQVQTAHAANLDDFIKQVRRHNVRAIERILRRNSNRHQISDGKLLYYTFYYNRDKAKENRCLEIVKLLVKYGLDINTVDSDSPNGHARYTALIFASGAGQSDVVNYLVEHGADVNARDADNWTALMMASSTGQSDIVNYLVEHGANVNARGNRGATALSLAYNKGEMEIYNYLKAQGAIEFEPTQAAAPPASSGASSPQGSFAPPPGRASAPAAPATVTLEPGAYTASGYDLTMSIAGYGNAGMVTLNEGGYRAVGNGTYQISNGRIVIKFFNAQGAAASLNGKTYSYTIDDSRSFSGNGETWVKTGY